MPAKTPRAGQSSDKPAPIVKRFDADALETPAEVKGPWPFTINGHEYELNDIREVDWQAIVHFDQTRDNLALIQAALPAAQVHSFFREKIPGWRLEAILRAYMAHADPDGTLPGNSVASRTS